MTAQTGRTPEQFLKQNTMRDLLGLPEQALDAVMATAYQLYQAGRYAEVEILCRGLVASDHTYWWSYALLAAALRRLGDLDQALEQIENGLAYEPGEPKLLLMRGEILAALGAWKEAQRSGSDAIASALPGDKQPQIAA